MKKILFSCFLLFLLGCEVSEVDKAPANNYINRTDNTKKEASTRIDCKINMDSLWEEYVTKKNTISVENRTSKILAKNTRETFTELNCSIELMRKFLILGGDFDDPGEESVVKRDGLMKISDNNNEKLINHLKKTLKLINGNEKEKSLVTELEEFKEGIKDACNRQKVPYKCDL